MTETDPGNEGVGVSSTGAPVVVNYQPGWPIRAAALTDELRHLLGSRLDRIDHIGSTAVPHMAAKDILDLQISVSNLDKAVVAFDHPLSLLGLHRSHHGHDHIPAGTSDDPTRWAKRLWVRRGGTEGDVNLHVRLVGSPNERLALLFRDWFRSHPEAVPAYAEFKRALACLSPDVDSYSDVKDPVVDLVIAVAESWAAAVGWQVRPGT